MSVLALLTKFIREFQSRKMRRTADTAQMRQKRNAHKELVGKHKGERKLGRSKRGRGTVLKRTLKNRNEGRGLDSFDSG